MKYRHKETGREVEALTFDELVAIGREQNPGREGPPWSFDLWGRHVTHETDDRYLVGNIRFRRGYIISFEKGDLYLWDPQPFHAEHDPVPAPVVVTPTETEMIEATERSANFMLGLAARARGALRLEEDNRRMAAEHERLRAELDAVVKDKLEAQRDLKAVRAALEGRPAHDAAAVHDLRRALDAEGYDLPALASMAIQKITDLDRSLTESKNAWKNQRATITRLQQEVRELQQSKTYAEEHLGRLAGFIGLSGMTWDYVVSETVSLIAGLHKDMRAAEARPAEIKIEMPGNAGQVWVEAHGALEPGEAEDLYVFYCVGQKTLPMLILHTCDAGGKLVPVRRGQLPRINI